MVGDSRGGPDALARIVRVEPRASVLRRTADDTDPFERVVVANADQLVVVSALADPEPRPAADRPLPRRGVRRRSATRSLVLTKADLADPARSCAVYAPLGVPHVVIGRRQQATD